MMRLVLVVALAWAASATAVFADESPLTARLNVTMEHRANTLQSCAGGRKVHLAYDVYGVAERHFVVLDDVDGLAGVECLGSAAVLGFTSPAALRAFVATLEQDGQFITTRSDRFMCATGEGETGKHFLHHVRAFQAIDPVKLEVAVDKVSYNDIFQNANVSMRSSGPCEDESTHMLGHELSRKICLGVNVDQSSCESAKQSIPIYSNQFVSLSCSDCFLGFESDVFFDLSIHWFRLENLAGGFRDMDINGDLTFEMDATTSWSTGVDRTLNVVPQTALVDFHVGPVPFRMTFAIPLRVTADASFFASATARAGVQVVANLGDMYIEWDRKNHWRHVTPSPKMTYTPVLSGEANFNSHADFALIPSVVAKIDNVFTYQMTLTPKVNLNVKGDTTSKQVCLDSDADVNLVSEAQFNIDFWHIHKSDTFGPKTIYDSGDKKLLQKCIHP